MRYTETRDAGLSFHQVVGDGFASFKMDMDMGSSSMGVFTEVNMQMARAYWYIIAGVVGFILLLRTLEYYQTWSRSVLLRLRANMTDLNSQVTDMSNEENNSIPNKSRQPPYADICHSNGYRS